MNVKQRLDRIAAELAARNPARQIIRVMWPDGRITGPEPEPGDKVVLIEVVYDANWRSQSEY